VLPAIVARMKAKRAIPQSEGHDIRGERGGERAARAARDTRQQHPAAP